MIMESVLNFRFHAVLALMLAFLFAPGPGYAQTDLSLKLQVGFDSYYKSETWAPVRVEVANPGSANLTTELRFLDDQASYGAPQVLYTTALELPSQSRKQITLYLPLHGQTQLKVDLVDTASNELLLTAKQSVAPLNQVDFLVGVIASDLSLLNVAGSLTTPGDGRVAVAHLTLDNLPVIAQAWGSLDLLVFNDVDSSGLTPIQRQLLRRWVATGGQLLIGGGPSAGQTLAAFRDLLPFETVTPQTLPHPLTELQKMARLNDLVDRGPYPAAVPVNPMGRIRARAGDQALLVSQSLGRGQVHYLALDLSLAPLDRLLLEPRFLARLFGQWQPKPVALTTQINTQEMVDSLALIPGQTLPTQSSVFLYLIIYVLVIGPVNYFILSQFKRREWAWFSIPVIILLFSGYSYFSSFRLRGGEPLLRQLAVVEAEQGAPLAEAATFVGLYSPRRADYRLIFDQPLPVSSLYSGYSAAGQLEISTLETTLVEGLKGEIGGVSAVAAYSQPPAPDISAALTLDRAEKRVSGTLINRTEQPLTDVLLIVNRQLIRLDTLPVGETSVDTVAEVMDDYSLAFYLPPYQTIDDFPAELSSEARLRLISRDTAVRAVTTNYYGDTELRLPADQLYLFGWQERPLLGVDLPDTSHDTLSETLIMMSLPYTKS